ncbi:hypothetical protein TEA_001360 [Camellia sinensis var. sinensis]|uniref:Uncharacterized protein n=1 Tax=Camellia sinensis var. sinensis TaxID=542762 RepID=A0A4V3WKJ0_CAMSN|nr:hypothetical protein TEA_001360 [Camellia sinensis var. sinensis]
MYRFAANLASKARVARNTTHQIGGRLSWSRNYAAEDYNFLIRGVEEIADAVGVTMGPKGRNVVIEQSYGSPKVRKGVIVAGSIKFKDKFKGIGSSLVRNIAYLVNGVARDRKVFFHSSIDGSIMRYFKLTEHPVQNLCPFPTPTCATVLTRAIFIEGCKSLAAGMNEKDLQRGIRMAVNAVVTNLKSRARMISTSEEIAQVGTTSANGEREIGELIAKAMEKVGKGSHHNCSMFMLTSWSCHDGKTLYNELEVVKGMKLDYRDYRFRYFITNLKCHQRRQRPLLIVADEENVATLNLDKLCDGIKFCAIPGFGENRKASLQDLAVLTGGNVENVDLDMLSSCKKDGKTLYNELEVVKGMKLDYRDYRFRYFITNLKCHQRPYSYHLYWRELEDPLILFYEKKISSINAIVKVIELALKRQRPLLIVTDMANPATLNLDKLCDGIKFCAITVPGFEENKKASLQDLAVLTGGNVELGMNLENVDLDMLGSCKKAIITDHDTVVIDGAGDKEALEERCEQIRSAIDLSTSDYDKEKLQERLAKLSGGVAVLKIGGASEAEVGEKKDRVTDALTATKAALEEGIVPGGGVALLYASKELDKLPTANFDQKIGVQIIQNALRKLLEQDNPHLGYDAAKGEYVDMVKAGIIDPLKRANANQRHLALNFPRIRRKFRQIGGSMGGMDF